MVLVLQNKLQHHIATLMWKAKDREQVKGIIAVYGKDAIVVFNMMLATYYDEVDATDLAEAVINKVK